MSLPTRSLLLAIAAGAAASAAHADPGLIVSRTVYPTGSNVPAITPNVTVLPNGAFAVGDGTFANVFKNETPDPSFGVTTGILIDRRTLSGSIVAAFADGALGIALDLHHRAVDPMRQDRAGAVAERTA